MADPNKLCLGCMHELAEGQKFCERCGWNNKTGKNKAHQLKPGTILQGKYLVGKVIGENSFGITYRGWDFLRQERVSIKESYPHGLVARDSTDKTTVLPNKGREDYVEKFKKDFIKETKTMQAFKCNAGIIGVEDAFAENQTVYRVMDCIEGKTLGEYAKEHRGKLSASIAIKLLEPVMDALEQMHANNFIHRDVNPDNIIISSVGKATLLNSSAARQISADGEHSLTIEVKHGYSPFEQYQTHGKQGPWTDVYALCATIYKLITGKTPPSASDRLPDDIIKRPSELGAKISPEQEKVLMKGLATGIKERYSTIDELKAAFNNIEEENKDKTDNDVKESKIENFFRSFFTGKKKLV